MKCLGLTKPSNFRKRCKNSTRFLYCWQHVWQPVTSLVTIFLFFAAVSNFTGFNLRDILGKSQQNAKPDISCSMEYPIIKDEKNKYSRNTRNPDIVVSNNGPIKAVSVSCIVKIYGYDLSKNEIIGFAVEGFKSFDHAFSTQELKPFEELRHSALGLNGKDILAIYALKVDFHRESDMNLFTLEEYFFIENQKILNNNDFKEDERYNRIIDLLRGYTPPKEDALSVKVTAADDHTWFMDADNWLSAKRGLDGKITIIDLPKEQEETPQDGYPFLDIRPITFKATGFYTEVQIVNDHIEVKIQFEIKNIGNASAIITEDGFDSVITIEPNQTKYYTKTIMVGRSKDNQEPLESFFTFLEEEKILHLKLSILYRPANDKENLFKSTVNYEIGKNKVAAVEN